MKIAIYSRLSQENKNGTGNEVSIKNQIELGVNYCNDNGYEYEIYQEAGVSGTTVDRMEFQRLLSDCRSGEVDQIWIKDNTRIERDPQVREILVGVLKTYKRNSS
jgi:DNA invertase Pin-like site-specific DNA recombinase